MYQTARGVAAAFGLLMLGVVPAPGAIRYVKQGAAGAGDGSSWTDAYPGLSAGLSAAVSGDQVWVAAGEYKPAAPGGPRSATFTLPVGVTLLGGFPGTPGQEVDASVRDPKAYVTVLSGDLNGDDNPPLGNRGDNAYHVVTIADSDANTKIDGFVVRCGQADGATTNDKNGGAVLIPTNVNVAPTITDCRFLDNASSAFGGAVYGSVTMSRCYFSRNRSERGGGYSGRSVMTDCIFDHNTSTLLGGAVNIHSYGTASQCTFTRNTAGMGGGAISLNSFSNIDNCTFQENIALYSIAQSSSPFGGGAVAALGGSIVNCRMLRNESTSVGGAVSGYVLVQNCVLAENRARDNGGAVFVDFQSGVGFQGVYECTIVNNSAGSGGAIYSRATSSLPIRNSILWGNRATAGSQILYYSSPTMPLNCIIEGGPAGVYPAIVVPPWSPTLIDADPLLSVDGSYRITSASPAIDAGAAHTNPPMALTDIDGGPRIVDGNGDGTATVDLGAFEYSPTQPAVAVDEAVLLVNAQEAGPALQRKLHLQQVGPGAPSFAISSDAPWLQATPDSGTLTPTPQEIIVQIDPSGLAYGEYQSKLTIATPGAVNPEIQIPVLLTVNRVLAVPSAYPTIQAAVNAAYLPGDVVELAPGIYSGSGNEGIDFAGKSLCLQSATASNPAVLSVVSSPIGFLASAQGRVEVKRVAVAFGYAPSLFATGASLTIRDSSFNPQRSIVNQPNGVTGAGNGLLRLVNCSIRGPGAARSSVGPAVVLNASDCTAVRCVITQCGDAFFVQNSGLRLYNSLVSMNSRGLYGNFNDVQLKGSMHVGNSTIALNDGEGIVALCSLLVENSIVWGNSSATPAKQIATGVLPDTKQLDRVHHCIIQNGADGISRTPRTFILGPQVIDAAPIFRDVDGVSSQAADWFTRDYRLTPCSPGVDAGDNGALPRDEFDLDGDGDTREPMPLDLAGQARRVDIIEVPDTGAGVAPIVDIGAYETVPSEQVEFCRAVSRKDHAAAGTFDVDLNLNATSRATVEPRLGGATRLVLTFTHPLLPIDGVFDANNLQVLGGAQVGGMALDGATAAIDLVAVPDKSCVCVTLLDMKDEAGAALPPLWTCVRNAYGDASNDGSVNLGDALTAKGFVGKPLTGSTARYDVNLTGQINVGDLLAIKAKASSTPAASCP